MFTFSVFTAALACLAPLANAFTTPSGDSPKGNPFSAPGLGSTVSVGQPFTVQWKPTTEGTVTLVLLKGPANNLAVVGPLAEKIENSGSYSWTPSTDLTDGPTSTTGYGIQLIVDADGTYQYTTQFGVSHGDDKGSTGKVSAPIYSSRAPVASVVSAEYASSEHVSTSAAPSTTISEATTSSTEAATTTTIASESESEGVVYITPTASVPTTIITSAVSTTSSASRASVVATSSAGARNATATGGAATFRSGLVGMAAFAGAAVLVM